MTDDIARWNRIDDTAERAALYKRGQWMPSRRDRRYDGT